MFASIVAILSKRVCLWVLKIVQWRKNESLFQYHYCSCTSNLQKSWKLCAKRFLFLANFMKLKRLHRHALRNLPINFQFSFLRHLFSSNFLWLLLFLFLFENHQIKVINLMGGLPAHAFIKEDNSKQKRNLPHTRWTSWW